MSIYAQYPEINRMTIPQRSRALAEQCVLELQKGMGADRLLDLVDLAVENEQYELAQGIEIAVKQFRSNPQLRLF